MYESPVFGLLDKKSIKLPGLKDFTWSPTQNVIAYWVPEDNNAPARVCIMEIPSRREIRVKNLFNVHDVSTYCRVVTIREKKAFFIMVRKCQGMSGKKLKSQFILYHLHFK